MDDQSACLTSHRRSRPPFLNNNETISSYLSPGNLVIFHVFQIIMFSFVVMLYNKKVKISILMDDNLLIFWLKRFTDWLRGLRFNG